MITQKLQSLRTLLLGLGLIVSLFLQGQIKDYGLRLPGYKDVKECNACRERISKMPAEVHHGIILMNGTLYFTMNDSEYFKKMFPEKDDGITVDIVSFSRYACGQEVPKPYDGWRKGRILKPIFRDDIYKRAYIDKRGQTYVSLGALPEGMNERELEFNVVFVKKKNVCDYYPYFNIESHRWDLIEMGLFNDAQKEKRYKKDSVTFYKTMKFVIPFEKNKYDYKQEDIKPLYDSLRLTDYNIKKIYISAYSSVEGSYENNLMLQEKRAKSIVDVMEGLQGNKIPRVVKASENWDEFTEGVRDTRYKYLLQFNKQEIKEKLSGEGLSRELEPILSKHRKAIITLELDKKNTYTTMDGEKLVSMFQQQISKDNYEEAKEIQEAILYLAKGYTNPEELIKKMDIPDKLECVDLLSNREAFRFYKNDNVIEAISNYEKLDKLFPDNPHIKYNLVVLRIKAWSYGDLVVEPDVLWNDLNALKGMGIEQSLIDRMIINYKIIECEYLMRNRKYEDKNVALRLIYSMYRKLELKDEDELNLAKFFVGYSRYDWAIDLLESAAKNIQVNEDLLFYYLNLTIINPAIVQKGFYQAILHNATNINKERFCKLFNTHGYGGVMFQLLDNPRLRKQYCDDCMK